MVSVRVRVRIVVAPPQVPLSRGGDRRGTVLMGPYG